MTMQQPTPKSELAETLTRSMHDHWGLFLAEGIILCVLGLGAIVVPPIAGLATTVFLGWLFLVAGLVGLFFTFRARSAPGFGWSLLSAAAAVIAGALLLWNPLQGMATLTYVLVAYFIVDGGAIIFLAIAHRREMSGKWEWMLLNGVIDLILAGNHHFRVSGDAGLGARPARRHRPAVRRRGAHRHGVGGAQGGSQKLKYVHRSQLGWSCRTTFSSNPRRPRRAFIRGDAMKARRRAVRSFWRRRVSGVAGATEEASTQPKTVAMSGDPAASRH